MKKLRQILLLSVIVTSAVVTSCSSDDTDGVSTAAAGTLVASVDGVSYSSLEISSSATVVASGGANNLVIIASNSDGNAFAFTIFGYNGAGTYPLGGGVNIANVASYTETMVDLANPVNSTTEIWQAPYDSNEVGSIVITEETSSAVLGTFEFTCKNVAGDNSVKTITEGSFNLNKQ